MFWTSLLTCSMKNQKFFQIIIRKKKLSKLSTYVKEKFTLFTNQLSKVISLRCFHEIFPKIERENFRNTVWKMLRFLAHFWQKFRESNVFTKEIVDLTKYFSMTKFFYTVRKITQLWKKGNSLTPQKEYFVKSSNYYFI